MSSKYVIAYRKQLTADNGDKFVSPWPAFRDEAIYEDAGAAKTALEELGTGPHPHDDGVYFAGVMRLDDFQR